MAAGFPIILSTYIGRNNYINCVEVIYSLPTLKSVEAQRIAGHPIHLMMRNGTQSVNHRMLPGEGVKLGAWTGSGTEQKR